MFRPTYNTLLSESQQSWSLAGNTNSNNSYQGAPTVLSTDLATAPSNSTLIIGNHFGGASASRKKTTIFDEYRNHDIVTKEELHSGSITGKNESQQLLGKIGINWFPPANAIIHVGHIPLATPAELVPSTTKDTPPVETGFRWDKTSDVSNRFGGSPQITYVVDVQDQAACGSCWAFSTAEVHASRARIWAQSDKIPMLSPSVLLSCVTGQSQGCSGGMPDEAASYCLKTGLPSMTCDDYNWCSARTAYCQSPGAAKAQPCKGGGGCMCCDDDRPTCPNYNSGCYTCSCDSGSSCSNAKCQSDSTQESTLYSWNYLTEQAKQDSSQMSQPKMLLQTKDGSYSEVQQQIMDELFNHGPVQANYFVL